MKKRECFFEKIDSEGCRVAFWTSHKGFATSHSPVRVSFRRGESWQVLKMRPHFFQQLFWREVFDWQEANRVGRVTVSWGNIWKGKLKKFRRFINHFESWWVGAPEYTTSCSAEHENWLTNRSSNEVSVKSRSSSRKSSESVTVYYMYLRGRTFWPIFCDHGKFTVGFRREKNVE